MPDFIFIRTTAHYVAATMLDSTPETHLPTDSDLALPTATWSQEQITAFYASYASKYDKDVAEDPDGYPAPAVVPSWVLHYFEKSFNAGKTVEILDLGCGTGLSAVKFFDYIKNGGAVHFQVDGVDATEEVTLEMSWYLFH